MHAAPWGSPTYDHLPRHKMPCVVSGHARSSQILLEFTDEDHKRETVYRAGLTMLSKDLETFVGKNPTGKAEAWHKRTLDGLFQVPAIMLNKEAHSMAARRYLLLVAAYLRVAAADVVIQDASDSAGDGKHQAWYIVVFHTDEAECDRTLERIGDGVELAKVG